MISIKSPSEIAVMKEGGKILADILKQLTAAAKPGVTTKSLDKMAADLISSHSGAKASFLGFDNFPSSICTSVNEEIVHGLPSGRELKNGDLLKIDVGIYFKGFHTDTAITKLIGGSTSQEVEPPNNKNRMKEKLINVTREALRIGISQARAGNSVLDIGGAIQDYVESNGFSIVRDLVGHGIGKELHEPPQVPNYRDNKSVDILKLGMTICIEPMVAAGGWKVTELEDGTFVTKDGSLSAHFEHTIAITENGPQILTW